MLIKSPSASAARECDVTPESVYLSRRRFMAALPVLWRWEACLCALKMSAMPG